MLFVRKNRYNLQCKRRANLFHSLQEKSSGTALPQMQGPHEASRKQIWQILGMHRVSDVRRVVESLILIAKQIQPKVVCFCQLFVKS